MLQIEPENAKFFSANDLGYKNASDKFSLAGTGDGNASGFAKCDADFELTADGENTLLYYWARAKISLDGDTAAPRQTGILRYGAALLYE